MKTRTIALAVAVLVVVAAALAGGFWLFTQNLYHDSYESSYSYRVSFSTNESLSNVTLYVPLPALDGQSALNDSVVRNVTVSRYGNQHVVGVDEPAPTVDFHPRLVETRFGPMLALTADEVNVTRVYWRAVENGSMGHHERINASEYDPSDSSMGVSADGTFQVSVDLAAGHTVDTRAPVGTEPTLWMGNQTQATCPDAPFDTQQCFSFAGRTLLIYDAPATTHVSVSTELRGANEWWVLGWNGNQYEQRQVTELTGAHRGWTVADGTLQTGWGNYR